MAQKWLVVKWPEVKDEFLVVFDKADLNDAAKAHPSKVIFMPPELKELEKHGGNVEALQNAYNVKKMFGGWIVPTGGKNEVNTQS